MDRKEMISDVLILIIATGVGMEINILWGGTIPQILFIIIVVLALLYVVLSHKNNVYYLTSTVGFV